MTAQGDTFLCRRCSQENDRLARPPLPGELGRLILESTCRPCWGEWQQQEVRVINELKLNFIEEESQHVLERHLREFLSLPST